MFIELKHALWGVQYGDFNIAFKHGNNSTYLLNKGRERERLSIIFAPTCNFTNRIVRLGEEDMPISSWLIRSRNEADGGIVDECDQGVVIFNADCPIIAVHEATTGRLAVLNGGFRCLVPEKKKGQKNRDRSIIRVLFEDHIFDPKNSKIFFGYGVGPCCYGAGHLEEVDPRFTTSDDLPIGKATRGPRVGQRSVDLYQLIYNQLMDMKVPDRNIFRDLTCTSCAGLNARKYWSHCRDNQHLYGRNAALAWLDVNTQ